MFYEADTYSASGCAASSLVTSQAVATQTCFAGYISSLGTVLYLKVNLATNATAITANVNVYLDSACSSYVQTVTIQHNRRCSYANSAYYQVEAVTGVNQVYNASAINTVLVA